MLAILASSGPEIVMHLRRALGAVAAAAAVISMPTMVDAESSLITSTTVPFMTEITHETLSYLGGSVITANQSITSLLLDCKSEYSANCSDGGLALPQTAVIGDTIQGLSYSVTSYFRGTLFIVTANVLCTVTDSASGGSCDYSTSSWFSSGTTSNSSTIDGASETYTTSLIYSTIDVISGLDKLAAATTTSNAAPASTATTTSAPYTGTATSTPSNSPSSSSKAWIAGPVIGAIAGVALIAGLSFWFLRRKKQKDTQGGDEAGPTDSTETRELQGGPDPAPEMHASYMPSELHSHDMHIPSELPPDNIARMELADSAQLDLDKKREMERRAASELPS